MGMISALTGRADSVMDRYNQGSEAFKNGVDLWACPFVMPSSDRGVMLDWMAGWMLAKQLAEAAKQESAGK